jgi:hypothetical protein
MILANSRNEIFDVSAEVLAFALILPYYLQLVSWS